MLCSNCQRELPETLVCEYCSPLDDEDLALAPVSDSPLPSASGPAELISRAEVEEVVLVPEERAEQNQCRKCQAVTPPGRLQCPVCGYNPQLSRSFDPLELDDLEGAMGFERFLMKHTSQNDPASLILWLRVFLGFLVTVYIVTARDLTSILVSGCAVGCYFWYVLTLGRKANFHAGKSAIPRLVLLFNRMGGWSGLGTDAKAPGAVITVRGGAFADHDLAALEDVLVVEVLDIPATGITDVGILYLQNMKNLKALVVQGCNVSRDSLDELQRRNKSVMIWR